MKKVLLIAGLVVLTAGSAFARNDFDKKGRKDGACGLCFDSAMPHFGGGAFEGRRGFKAFKNWDEAKVRDAMKARGVSEADIAKIIQIQKEYKDVMKRVREASFRQMMQERGVSDADITKMIQLQADSQALWEKYLPFEAEVE